MKRLPIYLLWLLAIVAFRAGAQGQAKDHQDLQFHTAPKPLAAGAVTHDWPCFLGPTHNANSTETRLLRDFPAGGPTLVWEVKRGSGYCAPAISGGRLIMLHRVGDEEIVDCLEAEAGKRFWRFSYPTTYQDRYGYCDGPRAAPVIDSGLVFSFGAEGKLHCLDLQTGQMKWKHELMAEYKVRQNFFGVGATPLVEGDNVIINVGAPGGPCAVAFNKNSGQVAWATDEALSNNWGPSYASPMPATVHEKRRVFVFAGGESRPATGGLMSIDPATGKVDFAVKHRSRTYESVNASSPLILGNQIFISECYGAGGSLLDILADGSAKEVWNTEKLATHFMNAIAKDGYLYGVDGHGPLDCPLVCLDLKTGEEIWRHEAIWDETINGQDGPSTRKMSLARCSLLLVADGRFLCLGEFGHLMWLDLSPKGYKEISRCWPVAAEESWTLPVLSHGLLYVCQNTRGMFKPQGTRLLCYDLRGDK